MKFQRKKDKDTSSQQGLVLDPNVIGDTADGTAVGGFRSLITRNVQYYIAIILFASVIYTSLMVVFEIIRQY